jgi:uncharacterized RDD family membrane protein YckC
MLTDRQPVAVPQGVGIRLAAYLIDVLAMSLPTAFAIAIGFGHNVPTARDLILHQPGWLYLTVGLVQLVYFTILEGAFATTLGKKACGLRVVAVADWSKCGWLRAFVRNVLLPVDEYLVYLPGVIAILVTDRHQRIGDLAAGTTVVRFVPASATAQAMRCPYCPRRRSPLPPARAAQKTSRLIWRRAGTVRRRGVRSGPFRGTRSGTWPSPALSRAPTWCGTRATAPTGCRQVQCRS